MTMMTNESYFLYLLLASNALLLAFTSVSLVYFERRWAHIEQFWKSRKDAALVDSGGENASEKIEATKRLEQRLGELQRTVKVLEMKTPTQHPAVEHIQQIGLPIENAVRMARMGASVEELTRNCGLNIGEARLMRKVHAKAAVAANAQ